MILPRQILRRACRPAACLPLAPLLVLLAGPADAAPAPGSLAACAAIAGHLHPGPAGFVSAGYHLSLNGPGKTPQLQAAQLAGRQHGSALPPAALADAASAAAIAVLQQVLHVQNPDAPAPCRAETIEQALAPLQDGVLHGGEYDFAWTDVQISASGNGVRGHSLHLHVAGPDHPDGRLRATLSLSGIGPVKPVDGLVIPAPQEVALTIAAPARSLATTLGAGLPNGDTVPVTITDAHVTLGKSRFAGGGDANLGADAQTSSATGHMTAENLDDAIEAARLDGLTRARTALFLSKLVAHRDGARLSWDLSWQQGMLFVNNIPLPLR